MCVLCFPTAPIAAEVMCGGGVGGTLHLAQGLLPALVNKVLLELSHARSLTHYLWLLSCYKAELGSCMETACPVHEA